MDQNHRTGRYYDRVRWLYPALDLLLRCHRNRVIDRVNAEARGRVLEVGVGTGVHLRRYQGVSVTGVDVSSGMLREAARQAEGSKVNLLLMDGEHLTFADESFDCVVMCHVLAVTANPSQMLQEAFRVLTPGGRLYVLNHETPIGGIRYWDRALNVFQGVVRCRTWFRLAEVPGFNQFKLIRRELLGVFGYSALTILEK